MRSALALVFLPFVSSIACVKTDSQDVRTSGIYADINVIADGAGKSLATAALKVGGGTSNTFINLTGDDTLVASSGGKMETMLRRELLGAVWYEWSFTGDAADTEFTIAFKRTLDAGAPDSKATLPAPFTLAGPAAGTTPSRMNDQITVTWMPSGTRDAMLWNAHGECIHLAAGTLSGDPGTLIIEAGKLVPLDGKSAVTCTITIEVFRQRPGTLSPGYGKGGVVLGKQKREITVRSGP